MQDSAPHDTRKVFALLTLILAAGALSALLLIGGTVALAALALLITVGFLIGFLSL